MDLHIADRAKPYWKSNLAYFNKIKIFIFYPITPKRNEAIDNTLMEQKILFAYYEIKIIFTHLY